MSRFAGYILLKCSTAKELPSKYCLVLYAHAQSSQFVEWNVVAPTAIRALMSPWRHDGHRLRLLLAGGALARLLAKGMRLRDQGKSTIAVAGLPSFDARYVRNARESRPR
jgi:hypothetical protein